MITIVNTGIANVNSVRNMLVRLGSDVRITDDAALVRASGKLILPGVGAFDAGMRALNGSGLGEAVRAAVQERGAWLLGICLGMQLLLDGSEEGELPGLALVPGGAKKFRVEAAGLRVPHMGWNVVRWLRESPVFAQDEADQRFYFVHSYHVECRDPADVLGVTPYGDEFVSVLQRGRVLGAQFHPEKSHRFGMDVLGRYARLAATAGEVAHG
jgi:imidazole glycerol-phosphate synthase subunit HisH